MASGNVLELKFQTTYGEKTFRFTRVKNNATSANVKNLVNTMIANGSIYAYPPLVAISAKIIVTSENAIDLS